MSRQTLRLVLLVSCAHGLVHVYELVFPSVEQLVKLDLGIQDTTTIGLLASAWALPFGLGAIFAGWLADRFGSARVLVTYLVGCGIMSGCVAFAPTFWVLLPVMFVMGSFASLYHPAGLAAISKVTTARNRGLALGVHGVLGSAGIAGAPLFAGAMLGNFGWRDVYLVLLVPGLLLGWFVWFGFRDGSSHPHGDAGNRAAAPKTDDKSAGQLVPFLLLCTVSAIYGFIYRGFLTFLPRYLGGIETLETTDVLAAESTQSYLSAMVLGAGIAGQFAAGHLAGRVRLEKLMLVILLGNVPFLFWMGTAAGSTRVVAALGFAIVFFMWQPVSNCLIANYTTTGRRSLAYGLSFFLSFGLGSTGATFAGWVADHYGKLAAVYPMLGYLGLASTVLAILIWTLSSAPHDEPAMIR